MARLLWTRDVFGGKQVQMYDTLQEPIDRVVFWVCFFFAVK